MVMGSAISLAFQPEKPNPSKPLGQLAIVIIRVGGGAREMIPSRLPFIVTFASLYSCFHAKAATCHLSEIGVELHLVSLDCSFHTVGSLIVLITTNQTIGSASATHPPSGPTFRGLTAHAYAQYRILIRLTLFGPLYVHRKIRLELRWDPSKPSMI